MKSLEINYKNVWECSEADLFGGLGFFSAIIAISLIFFFKLFDVNELLDALLDGNWNALICSDGHWQSQVHKRVEFVLLAIAFHAFEG